MDLYKKNFTKIFEKTMKNLDYNRDYLHAFRTLNLSFKI